MLVTIPGDLNLRDMVFFRKGKRPFAGDLLLDTFLLEGLLNFVCHGYIMELRKEKGFTMQSGQIIRYIMQVMLISSRSDPAGRNIRHQMRELLQEKEREDVTFALHEVEGRLIFQDGIDAAFDADLIIFLSRHTSARPFPLLSVHVTGNPSGADLGGKPYSFPPASPLWMRSVLRSLFHHAPPEYGVTYEVTHHGPTELTTPSFFVEIGSNMAEWEDPRAGKAVAESVFAAQPEPSLCLLGLGGNHYATRATEMARDLKVAFGHIIHSRDVPSLDRALLANLWKHSGAEAVYIDRNALSSEDVHRMEALLGEADLTLLSEGEIKTCGNLPWKTYRSLRALAEEAIPSSRLVVDGLVGEGTPVMVQLDPSLLSEALKADRNAVEEGLRSLPLAHLIRIDGIIPPVFLTFEGNQSIVINHLIRLCVKIIVGNQKTSLDGDSLIIHGLRFDPQKARELGIPSGPLYGMLSAGKAIERDGRMITPEMVQTETKRILHISGLGRYV
jgi:D-aminoacyl-tRNA deacylase